MFQVNWNGGSIIIFGMTAFKEFVNFWSASVEDFYVLFGVL